MQMNPLQVFNTPKEMFNALIDIAGTCAVEADPYFVENIVFSASHLAMDKFLTRFMGTHSSKFSITPNGSIALPDGDYIPYDEVLKMFEPPRMSDVICVTPFKGADGTGYMYLVTRLVTNPQIVEAYQMLEQTGLVKNWRLHAWMGVHAMNYTGDPNGEWTIDRRPTFCH